MLCRILNLNIHYRYLKYIYRTQSLMMKEKKLFIRDEELSLLSDTQELEIFFISIFL